MNFKKNIFFLFLLPAFLMAGTNLNINLNVSAERGKVLPLYKTSTNVSAPLPVLGEIPNQGMQNAGDKIKKTKEPSVETKRKNGLTLKAGNVKVVSNDDIEKINPANPHFNVCEAFISDNAGNAFDYGYSEGVKYTKLYIGKFLLKHKKQLDILFPLKQLYLNDGILQPPVVKKEDKGSYIFQDGNVYKQFGVRYYIQTPARFVTMGSYRKWEDFLLDYAPDYYYNTDIKNVLNFSMNINYSDSAECNRKIREKVFENFRQGFFSGEKEVFTLMESRLQKLQNFLDGLYLYNELYYRGIINPPVISEFVEPVYKNERGKQLVINEKVLKIVKPASFNTETKKWKTFIITNDKITTAGLRFKGE